jgi:hypothetical protein
MSPEEILGVIENMEKSSKALRHEILSLCWFMRGSLTYDDAMQLSYDDRLIISDIVKGNMEVTKKSGMPFF